GIILYGYYRIASFTDTNNFTITAASTATATASGGVTPQFVTIANSATVTVNLPSHGYAIGARFNIDVPTMVGGLNLAGPATIASILANSFTFVWPLKATTNDSEYENNGKVQILYLLTHGSAFNTLVSAYGSGIYSAGIYGVAGTPSFPAKVRSWFWDNWGQD